MSIASSTLSAPNSAEQLQRLRHTCAHVMAMAVQHLFPETKVTIGPTTETGFYYDFDRAQAFTPEDLGAIATQMRRIIKANLWLAPVQIRLLVVSDAQRPYALEVLEQLQQRGLRAEVDQTGERLGKQIRLAALEKIPVVAVVGKREVETQTLSVRTRQTEEQELLKLSELCEKMQSAIDAKQQI